MDEKQMEDLNRAISKLSEKDQEQIAAAGVISDEQCEKIKKINPKAIVLGYGGPMITRPRFEIEELLKRRKKEEKSAEISPSVEEKTDEQ